jgi:hypothetical protein
MEKLTLILSPWETEDSVAIEEAAAAAGWMVRRVSGWRDVLDLEIDGETCVYGERLFVIFVAEHLPVVYLEPPRDWIEHVPETLRKRDIRFTILGNARRGPFPAFVKPAVDKAFVAGVFTHADGLPSADELPDHVPVYVSEIVSWLDEFRCFVVDGQIRTLSPYIRDGEIADGPDHTWPMTQEERVIVTEFAQAVVDRTQAYNPPGFVLDVGRIEGRGWAALEVNPANASGVYGCDLAEVLNAVRASCILKKNVGPEHRRWIQEFVSWDVD